MSSTSKRYQYADGIYETEEDAQRSVIDFKNRLENRPSTYCSVKKLGGSLEEGWVVPPNQLSDEEILSLSGDGFYAIHSSLEGQVHMGLSADEVLDKIQEYKKKEAQFFHADKIIYVNEITLEEDMSGYF